MWKTLLVAGISGFVGYWAGSIFGAPSGGAPSQEEEDVAPVARMARDVRLMCRDFEPVLQEIEQAYIDGRISSGELYSIGTHINRLM